MNWNESDDTADSMMLENLAEDAPHRKARAAAQTCPACGAREAIPSVWAGPCSDDVRAKLDGIYGRGHYCVLPCFSDFWFSFACGQCGHTWGKSMEDFARPLLDEI